MIVPANAGVALEVAPEPTACLECIHPKALHVFTPPHVCGLWECACPGYLNPDRVAGWA